MKMALSRIAAGLFAESCVFSPRTPRRAHFLKEDVTRIPTAEKADL